MPSEFLQHEGWKAKVQNNPGQIWRPMPHQGGDTVDVLTKLGYTEDQIKELLASDVVKES